MHDLLGAYEATTSAQPGYSKAKQYYDGDVPEVFASTQLKRALKASGTSFRFNFAKTPVNSVADRLEINAVKAVDEAANGALQELWESNELDIEANDVHRKASMFGDAYVFVWGDSDNVEITYNSPQVARVYYEPGSNRKKRMASKVWVEQHDDKALVRINLYYPDVIAKFISTKEKPEGIEDFQPYLDASTDENGLMENPYGEIPIFHFRTERPYGKPEHKDAYGPQDIINKLVVNQMAASDFQAFRQRYVLANSSLSNEAEDFGDDLDSETEAPDLKAGAGELWWLNNVEEVGEFSSGEVDEFLKPFEKYVRAMAATTDTPLYHFESQAQPPSGEARRVAESSLVKKVEDRQLMYGSEWKQVLRFALKILGHDNAHVKLSWDSAASQGDSYAWEVALKKLDAGMPLRVVLREMGYDDEQIDEAYRLIDEEGLTPMQVMQADTGNRPQRAVED